MVEQVVLVNTNNEPIGLADKATVHNSNTPLHRAFSLFIFNSAGQLLLQQRAKTKTTWPGVWSNSVCGHPGQGESAVAAARRRAKYELGIELTNESIIVFEPNYQYRYAHKGVVEHEICPVLAVMTNTKPLPNPAEVEAIRWVDWFEFVSETRSKNSYSEWCVEETQLLTRNKKFNAFYNKYCSHE
jgi:isopentenyl-diphosphate delta-isomerase